MSKALKLNSTDYKKILKGAAIAFGGAAIMQLNLFISSGVTFDWKVWITSLLAVGINAVWKFLQNQK